jgi:hypothetical protein
MNIFSWLFNRNQTINEPVKTKAGRGTWERCRGTGETLLKSHKVGTKWFGTCTKCGKAPIARTKAGMAWPHKHGKANG